MVSWINYALVIEFIAIALMIYGLVAFFNVLRGLEQTISYPLYFILAALALQIVQGATIGIFLFNKVDHTSALWVSYPFIALIGAYLLTIGSKKFLSTLKRQSS